MNSHLEFLSETFRELQEMIDDPKTQAFVCKLIFSDAKVAFIDFVRGDTDFMKSFVSVYNINPWPSSQFLEIYYYPKPYTRGKMHDSADLYFYITTLCEKMNDEDHFARIDVYKKDTPKNLLSETNHA